MVFAKSPDGALKSAAHAILFFALLLLFSSCSLAEESSTLAQDELPEAVFYNYQRKDFDETGLSFIARAERAEYFKEKRLLVIHSLSFEDIGEDGRTVTASGEAEEAYYYEDTGDAEVKGMVRIRSLEENASFETDRLKYFAATESLEGGPEDPVLVRVGEKLFLQGRGFFADVREKTFAFRGGVEGMIQNKAAPDRKKE